MDKNVFRKESMMRLSYGTVKLNHKKALERLRRELEA